MCPVHQSHNNIRTYAVVSSVYYLWSLPFLVAVCGWVVFRSASATGDQSL